MNPLFVELSDLESTSIVGGSLLGLELGVGANVLGLVGLQVGVGVSLLGGQEKP